MLFLNFHNPSYISVYIFLLFSVEYFYFSLIHHYPCCINYELYYKMKLNIFQQNEEAHNIIKTRIISA